MTILRRILIGAGISMALSSVVWADGVKSYSNSIGPLSTDFTFDGATGDPSAITLSNFVPGADGIPTDAILTGVGLELFVSETTSNLSLTNGASVSELFNASLSDIVYVDGDTGSAEQAFLTPGGTSVNLVGTGFIHLGPGTGPNATGACPQGTPSTSCSAVTYPNITASGDSGLINLAQTYWSGYSGAGSFQISGFTLAHASFDGGGGNIQYAIATNATITADVVYSYTEPATPEPTTMVLFGTALVGLGLLRKRARG